ncbi:MAG: MFS transporter [Bdellovibrionales bacterium]
MDFKRLVAARFLFTFAVQMQAVVLGWRIYDLLKDPLYLGFIGLTEAAPAIGLALYAGYLVDRMRPLKAYQGVLGVSLLSALVVLIELVFESSLTLTHQVGFLYSAAFLTGCARAFSQPAIFATIPRLVERSQLLRATAVSSSFMQVARIGGPAVGGLIFGYFGALSAAWIVALLLVGSLGCLSLIQTKIEAGQTQNSKTSIQEELLSGVRFVFKHPILFPALSLDMISVLFGGVTALLPIFAEEILGVGPKGLGLLRAAPAVGAALMMFFLTGTQRLRTGRWLLAAVTGFGLSILVFGLSRNFYLSFSALLMSGVFDSISVAIRSGAVQLFSPDSMRGKIAAVNSIFIGSSNEIGELESGIAAKLLGTVPAVYLGAAVCLLTVAATAVLSPALRNLDLVRVSKDQGSQI